jgi:hypothetical protein
MASEDRYDKRGGGDQLIYGELADGEEMPIRASDARELYVFPDLITRDLLSQILAELQSVNLHLLAITDERF